jgi:hypothetical protein
MSPVKSMHRHGDLLSDRLVFDRHTQTPQDPAHLLLQNLSKYLISATLDLLNSNGKKEFVDSLASIELPRGWSRFQNPVHLKSYFFFQITLGY